MADYDAIANALASALSGISNVQESAYLLGNPTPPAAEVQFGETQYDEAFGRGHDTVTAIVRVFVGFSSDVGAFKRLRPMMAGSGSESVKAALETDRTLGGLVYSLQVKKMTGEKGFLREVTGKAGRGSAQGPLLGAEWTVEMLVPGK